MRVAWNGVDLSTPDSWEPVAMGKRTLTLGPSGHPALDLKWNPIRGRFAADKHLKRMARGFPAKQGGSLKKANPPGGFPSRWNSRIFFTWELAGERGGGCLLYDAKAGAALAAQWRTAYRDEAVKALSGLHMSGNGSDIPFALYDIRAVMPAGYELGTYAFQPGLFRLTFQTKKSEIELSRFGPAEVLLKQGMHGFLEKQYGEFLKNTEASETPEGLLMQPRRAPSYPLRLAGRLGRRKPYKRLEAWRPEGSNRILCLRAASASPLDAELLREVRMNYVLVPQEKAGSADHSA
ncbi:hypothetical protein [Desulfohalovibrio reitneri]|uniref:hypothetical protein n=1 Tax=Desulfohalovibrio reitneri TaxID=1307759 RepID=UPI0004A7805E|nr:hypothetical protein [Desulfohalovibrio reitneri]